MTDEVELHVGYVGRTRDGKRVEVTERIVVLSRQYFVLSNGECVWPNGLSDKRETNRTDIIGPWTEPTTEYPIGQWIGWNGGECPVHPETVVEVEIGFRDEGLARHYIWEHDGNDDNIIAFRIVTPYVEPKPPLECWVNMYGDKLEGAYLTEKEADDDAWKSRTRCVRMVEADQ